MIYRGNYLRVREFLTYLREVMQLNSNSTDRYWSYLKHLLVWADETPLSRAATIRPTFTSHVLSLSEGTESSRPLASITVKKILQVAKRLFLWAKTNYPQDFRQIPSAWVDALRLPRGTEAVAEHEFVKLEEVLELIRVPVAKHDLATWRDQAAVAMLFLSGARAAAFSSLTLECVDLENQALKQWTALGVRTKNSKSATTFLLDIPELLDVVKAWDAYIRSRLPPSATWYTPIINQWDEQTLSVNRPGTNRNIALAKRIRRLYALADLPYHSPHAFRHGHAVFALQHCRTMADYKAVSMNLMHGNIRITDGIYAPLASTEVKQRVTALTAPSTPALPALGAELGFAEDLTDEQLAVVLTIAARRLAR